MTPDNHILTKDVCKGRGCSCWVPDTCRSVAHFTSFPSLVPPPPAGTLNVRTPYTVSVSHRGHSWRTKGRHHDSCNRMSLSSMFYRMSNILQYISLHSLLLPDQATALPAPRSSVTVPAGPPTVGVSLRGEGRALSTVLATWAGRLPALSQPAACSTQQR